MKNIAILGFGTVGSGVYEVLKMNAEKIRRVLGEEIEVGHILDRKTFDGESFADIVTDDFEKIISDENVDLVVETMGGVEPAFTFSKKALEKGKTVVSSNKELVEKHGDELMKIAYENGVKYLFEASVGGGIPILRPLSLCLAGNEIKRIEGILNGTTNYILTRMSEEGLSFGSCLKDAQDNGYAEADPSADVKGYDAGRKIAILTSIATGKNCSYEDIYVEGIDEITADMTSFAKSLGKTIKLVARARMEGSDISVIVSPYLLDDDEKLSSVNGVFNAVLVDGNAVGETLFYGQGAGKLATASAVVGDVVNAFMDRRYAPLWSDERLKIVEKDKMKVRALLMFKVEDRAGLEDRLGKKFLKNSEYSAFYTDVMTERDLEAFIKERLSDVHDVKVLRCRV